MPEGDTLHRLARKLGPLLVGEHVVRVLLPRRTDRTEGLTGNTITAVEARGKNLLVHFSSGFTLHTHLAMLGAWRIVPAPARVPPDAVAVIETRTTAAICTRAPVARLLRTRDVAKDRAFRDLGPDLLGETFDEDQALHRIRRRGAPSLAEALLDQGGVSGIGNVWKSELCFNCRLDPFAPLAFFADDELRALIRLAREQLQENVLAPRRARPDPFEPRGAPRTARRERRVGEARLSVYERSGEPCYDCGTVVRMARQGPDQRSTYWCPTCQPTRDRPSTSVLDRRDADTDEEEPDEVRRSTEEEGDDDAEEEGAGDRGDRSRSE